MNDIKVCLKKNKLYEIEDILNIVSNDGVYKITRQNDGGNSLLQFMITDKKKQIFEIIKNDFKKAKDNFESICLCVTTEKINLGLIAEGIGDINIQVSGNLKKMKKDIINRIKKYIKKYIKSDIEYLLVTEKKNTLYLCKYSSDINKCKLKRKKDENYQKILKKYLK